MVPRPRFWLPALLSLWILVAPSGARAEWRTLFGAPNRPDRYEDLSFADPQTGWAVTLDGWILKTTDGGDSWSFQHQTGEPYRTVLFASRLHGYIGLLAANHPLLETRDGGVTWAPVSSSLPGVLGICGLWGVDEKVTYGAGAYWGSPHVVKTTDAGRTWQVFDLSSLASGLIDCCFFSARSGVVVGTLEEPGGGRRAVVLTTSNGGETWERPYISSPSTVNYGWKIAFPSEKAGYVAVECGSPQATILKTTDLGRTWTTGAEQFTNLQGVGFATSALGWVGGWNRACGETTDGGQSWHAAGFGWNVNSFCMFGDSLGYAAGQWVYRYRLQEAGRETSSVASLVTVDAPLRTWAFPNPFVDRVQISYLLTRPQAVDVSVYAVTGAKLVSLFQGSQGIGEHVIRWDARREDGSRLPNGTYFYRVETETADESGAILVLR